MRISRALIQAIVPVALFGCATSPGAGPEPNADAARTQAVLAAANRWTGSFNPTQSYTGAAVTTTRQKAYGSIELTVGRNRPTMTHVILTVSVPVEPGLTNLGWAIYPGNCGSGDAPLMAPGAFPSIVLSANGRGSLEDDIGFTLPTSGTFHANVFRGNGNQLSDVITCASLRRG